MALQTIPFEWTGEAMVPMSRFRKLAERQFQIGKVYVFEPKEQISHKERGFFMASVKNAWDNLPDDKLELYPTPSALRKWALIKAGWREEGYLDAANEQAAGTAAALLQSLLTKQHGFSIVQVSGKVVRHMVARSQKVGDPELGYMTREEWKQSKDDVLAILAGHIGVTAKQLEREGRA